MYLRTTVNFFALASVVIVECRKLADGFVLFAPQTHRQYMMIVIVSTLFFNLNYHRHVMDGFSERNGDSCVLLFVLKYG